MDPITAIAALNAALTLVEQLIPIIRGFHINGQVTAEQQQEVLDRYNALKAQGDAAFSGPQWQLSKPD